ncbi:hypothetical protein B296_00034579 [Ensete ventricosum]|uniref:Uncharacterized protein n=1 Tax=Ensete ventricosum TaxID=4639 RepID=A0A426XRM5_ENSVE|nr:hypothetical protein B296_00034579 [Ensete ventricosum]
MKMNTWARVVKRAPFIVDSNPSTVATSASTTDGTNEISTDLPASADTIAATFGILSFAGIDLQRNLDRRLRMLQGAAASCRHTIDRNRVTITLFPLIFPLFCCDWPSNIAAHSQRRASAAHLLSAAVALLPAAPFRRSYSTSRRNTSTRLTARRAHLRLFLLNISTRLPPFLCFPS